MLLCVTVLRVGLLTVKQYTYYTISALGFRVPTSLKRSLTSLQIAQFVGGSSLASSYLLINYAVPLHKTEQNFSTPSSTSAVVPPVSTEASGFLFLLKNYASRALGVPAGAAQVDVEYRMTSCLDTSGERFAVLLNVMYLFPLTWLFVRFFIRSYLSAKEPGKPRPAPMQVAEKVGVDAFREVSREMHRTVNLMGDQRNGHV